MAVSGQRKIGFESYKGFLFQSAQNKKIAEYKEAIDVFHENIKKPYDDNSAFPEKLEEILTQAILIKTMPDCKIIKIDNGSESSQIDLIARKEGSDIGIEVTQFTEENYNILKAKKELYGPPKKQKESGLSR